MAAGAALHFGVKQIAQSRIRSSMVITLMRFICLQMSPLVQSLLPIQIYKVAGKVKEISMLIHCSVVQIVRSVLMGWMIM